MVGNIPIMACKKSAPPMWDIHQIPNKSLYFTFSYLYLDNATNHTRKQSHFPNYNYSRTILAVQCNTIFGL